MVSNCIPRKVMEVDRPSILDDFIGALMHSYNDSIEIRLLLQMGKSGGPAVRKSSRVIDDGYYTCSLRSSELPQRGY